MYRIKSFFKRLYRAINWGIFIFKQPPWQEYDSLIEIINKRLLDMAKYFEEFEAKKGFSYVGVENDVKYMKLAAKLLKMSLDEYYQNI